MSASNVFFRIDAILQKCPECETVSSLRNSHSHNFMESLIKKITFFKIYKCSQCGWRGYKSSVIFTHESFKNLMLYIAVALICGVTVRMIITKLL